MLKPMPTKKDVKQKAASVVSTSTTSPVVVPPSTTAIKTKQVLFLADNLSLMKDYIAKGKESFVDLIYIDPPFNSKRNYNIIFNSDSDQTEQAFTDIWSNVSYLDELEEINEISPNLYSFLKNLESTGLQKSMLSYLTAMGIRLFYMRKLLKDSGSIYYHCDPTASHYIKIVMDYVFGIKNFRNEIVWNYEYGGRAKNFFGTKHDIIFLYTKTKDFIWNDSSVRIPHLDSSLEVNYTKTDEEGRRYREAT